MAILLKYWYFIVIGLLIALLIGANVRINSLKNDVEKLDIALNKANDETKKANDTITKQNAEIEKIGVENDKCTSRKEKLEKTLTELRKDYKDELDKLAKITSVMEKLKNVPIDQMKGVADVESNKEIIRQYNSIFSRYK